MDSFDVILFTLPLASLITERLLDDRETHGFIDGSYQEVDDQNCERPFKKSGASLQHPGDIQVAGRTLRRGRSIFIMHLLAISNCF